MEFILKLDLVILIDPKSHPTYESTIGTSWIDLVLIRNIVPDKIGNFKVKNDISMSDHIIITFNLKMMTKGK